jgi:superfamily II DNA or RNA helicase
MDIVIKKVSEVYVKVLADRGILREIYERFSFEIPNARFDPRVKNRIWDGRIRMLNLKDQTFYIGLVPELCSFLKKSDYKFTLDPNLYVGSELSSRDLNKLIETLEIPYEVRDYQLSAVLHAVNEGRGLILSATGSGKSLIQFLIASYYRALGMKTLLIVPTQSLVEQMYKDIESYSPYVPNLHTIMEGQGRDVPEDSEIVIATWQSIFRLPLEWFSQFSVVLGDECHLYSAKSLSGILQKMIETKYRFGFTGSLKDSKTDEMVLKGLFGPVFQASSTRDLIDREYLSKLYIYPIVFKYSDEVCRNFKGVDYQSELSYLIANEQRNKAIVDITINLKGNSLLLFERVDTHGKLLYNIFLESTDRPIYFIHGGVDVDERENVRKVMEERNDVICIASAGVFSTGINIRNLHNVLLTSLGKSKVRVLQSIGRSLRLHDSKDHASLIDFSDDLRGNRKKLNYSLRHFNERLEVYRREQHVIKQVKVVQL